MGAQAGMRTGTPVSMTIGGVAARTVGAFGVINPAAGGVFADSPDCTPQQLDEAVGAGAQAFPAWRADEALRRRLLLACADLLDAHVEELARLRTSEQGAQLRRSQSAIGAGSRWLRDVAEIPIATEVVREDGETRSEVHRRPLGVVAAITPWNYPVLIAMWKVGPALLAGNTMVLKPSPYTPLTTLRVGELLREVLPPGVLNVVAGGDELGERLTRHPGVRKISFTVSVAAGKRVALAAAEDLKRLNFELGGNDATIILDDADPKTLAAKLLASATRNGGQNCAALKRVYAHERVYDALTAELTDLASRMSVGDGMDPDTDLGPLNNAAQVERVSGLVDEEQFGPVLPVLPYTDVEDAVARANATTYGLGGSVWSPDLRRAVDVASRLERGTAWINRHTEVHPHVPFGGWKWSGVGVEHGTHGLDELSELQVIAIAKP